MTTIVPELSDVQLAELPSQAEAKVYRALRDGLPQDFTVLFQVGWILRREEEQAKDGETDFLVCHPELGYVCIEVKGGRDAQAAKINARIVDLVARQGVAAGDIAVLVADAIRKGDYYAALRRLPLPRPAVWLEEGVRGDNTVLIDTIQRFKGLESPVVILWGLDTIDLARSEELLYVGMSRAKSLLLLVARSETCGVIRTRWKQEP